MKQFMRKIIIFLLVMPNSAFSKELFKCTVKRIFPPRRLESWKPLNLYWHNISLINIDKNKPLFDDFVGLDEFLLIDPRWNSEEGKATKVRSWSSQEAEQSQIYYFRKSYSSYDSPFYKLTHAQTGYASVSLNGEAILVDDKNDLFIKCSVIAK